MSFKVLAPGTYTLLVDAGRPNTRGLGLPVGGPADRASFKLGNALLGNPPDAPALEITLSGPTLLALDDVGLCVFGALFPIDADRTAIECNCTFTLRRGQTLHIGGTPEGCRAYLCVVGGFRAKAVLGSVTGFEPVKAGEVLECAESVVGRRGLNFRSPSPPALEEAGLGVRRVGRRSHKTHSSPAASLNPPHPRPFFPFPGARGKHTVLRCLPGPQADWFDDSLFKHPYRVTPATNRMGIRLDGPALSLPKRDLVSEPVAPGAVQITNDGKPIVLGVDGQTIGGYPKIAHVISADLDLLGQLRPGDEIHFQRVSEKEAEAAGAQARETFRLWLRRIAVGIS